MALNNIIDARHETLRTLFPLGPPSTNDLLFLWLVSEGGTGETLNDLWYTMLIAKGATPAPIRDMWFEVLGNLGYVGAIKDRELAFWIAGGFGGGGGPTDPLWANVRLLAQFDGTDGQTAGIVTQDPDVRPVTLFNAAELDTARVAVTGSVSSLLLPSAGTADYAQVPHTANLQLSNNDFCIEFFVFPDTNTVSTHYWAGKGFNAPQREWRIQFRNLNDFEFDYSTEGNGVTWFNVFRETWNPTPGNWYHVAFTRNGNDFRCFIDGVQLGTTKVLSGQITVTGATEPLLMGNHTPGSTDSLDGSLDQFRITIGAARYTANFTPPTEAFPTS
jgi:hypothetical protein